MKKPTIQAALTTGTENIATRPTKAAMKTSGSGHQKTVALAPAFIALADEFGMVPERLAERVISAFAATKPSQILVKPRVSSSLSLR